MKLQRIVLAVFAAMTLLLLAATPSRADHIAGATLHWAPSGNNQVDFTLTVYFRRSEILGQLSGVGNDIFTEGGGGLQIFFGDATSTPLLRFKIVGVDLANDIAVGLALEPGSDTKTTVTKDYSGKGSGPFSAEARGCCRPQDDFQNNRASDDDANPVVEIPFRLTTSVTLNGNSSPVNTTALPIIEVCEGTNSTFALHAFEPNGENIRWRLATNVEATNDATQPSPTNITGASVTTTNAATGDGLVTWNNQGLDKTKFWTIQVIAEDLDAGGNVKSWTPVDFLLKIIECSGPREDPGGSLTPNQCWPPNHKFVNVHANLTLGSYTAVTLVSIASNENVNSTGDGNTDPDWAGVSLGTDDRDYQLRCERKGNGTGRVYTMTYVFTGPNLPPFELALTFTVPHDQSKKKMVTGNEAMDAEGKMTLSQNRPDPFTGETSVDFTLKEARTIALKIYNVQGEEVATLANGLHKAGTYTATWNGVDKEGNPAPSGVYFYKLESGECNCGAVMEMHLNR